MMPQQHTLARWLPLLFVGAVVRVNSFANHHPSPLLFPSLGSSFRFHRKKNSFHHRHHHRQQQQRGDDDDDDNDDDDDDGNSETDDSDDDPTLLLARYSDRFRKFRTPPHHARGIRRVLLLSDLHMDYPANREWLRHICNATTTTTSTMSDDDDNIGDEDAFDSNRDDDAMMVVAGDVSHDLDILRWTFRTLKSKFGEVAFTPGNHELWIDKGGRATTKTTRQSDHDEGDDVTAGCRSTQREGDGCATSVEKLEKTLQLCIDEDVRIGPVKVGSSLWVIPLLSWHHGSFDTEPPIECWGGIPSARRAVVDYRKTKWPDPLSPLDDSAARFVDGLNDVVLDLDGIFELERDDDDAPSPSPSMLTFSHFLPRIELIPEKRYLTLPTLLSCVGSSFLEARVRRMGNSRGDEDDDDDEEEGGSGGERSSRHLHAFGHSHLSWDATIDGVRYAHVPLAYPREWEQRRPSLEIGSMRGEEGRDRYPVCVWEKDATTTTTMGDDDGAVGDDEDGLVSAAGFPSRRLGGWWSEYYAVVPRQPCRNKDLAPWVAKRFRQLPGGGIESFDHAEVAKQLKIDGTGTVKL